jgi:hypothetical protein
MAFGIRRAKRQEWRRDAADSLTHTAPTISLENTINGIHNSNY